MNSFELAIHLFEKVAKLGNIISIEPLEASPNTLFLVNYEYVVHIPRSIGRQNEAETALYNYLSTHYAPHFLPSFVVYFPSGHYKIEKFEEGKAFDFSKPMEKKQALSAITVLSELHRVPIQTTEYDLFGIFNALKKASKEKLPSGFERRLLKSVSEIRDSRPMLLCHNLVSQNDLLFREDDALLLDTQTVGMNSPLFDIALFTEQYGVSPNFRRELLELYFTLVPGYSYSLEELDTMRTFVNAYLFYSHMSAFLKNKDPNEEERANEQKRRFLEAFEATLV